MKLPIDLDRLPPYLINVSISYKQWLDFFNFGGGGKCKFFRALD